MVRIHPDPPLFLRWLRLAGEDPGLSICMTGGLAQLGEHLLCKQGVVGSIPSSSTNHQCIAFCAGRAEGCALAIEPVRVIRGYSNRDIGCRSLTIRKK